MLTALLPPGRLWRLVGESLVSSILLASGDELARLDARAMDLLDEADPATAVESLPEWEDDLDLDSNGTTQERQARLVAHLVARQKRRPVDFRTALAPLLGQAAADVIVLERTAAMAASMGDAREKKRFFIYRDPTLLGNYYLDSAQALAYNMARSTTEVSVIESINFLCDDPFSLCDRDLLGA